MSENVSSPSPPRRERFPYTLRVEPWLQDPPKWYPYFVSLIAIVAALILGGILLALSGGAPPGPIASWAYEAANRLLDALDAAARAEGRPTRSGVQKALQADQRQ